MNKLIGMVTKTIKTIVAELSDVVIAVITIGMFLLAAAYCLTPSTTNRKEHTNETNCVSHHCNAGQ